MNLNILDKKTLLRTRLCDLVSARVENGRTGGESEFYRFQFTDWVNIVALTTDRRLIIIRQFRFGTERVEIEIPGGAIEEGESPLEAGRRELLEETGYAGGTARIIGKVCPNPAIQNNWCYTLLVENAMQVAEQRMDDMEDISVELIALEEMDLLIQQGAVNHGLVLNAMMFFERAQTL